jgi:hypothetical protein
VERDGCTTFFGRLVQCPSGADMSCSAAGLVDESLAFPPCSIAGGAVTPFLRFVPVAILGSTRLLTAVRPCFLPVLDGTEPLSVR